MIWLMSSAGFRILIGDWAAYSGTAEIEVNDHETRT